MSQVLRYSCSPSFDCIYTWIIAIDIVQLDAFKKNLYTVNKIWVLK